MSVQSIAASEARSHRGTRDKDISAKALSQVGYWRRDEVVAMDRNATLAMLKHHPARAGQMLRDALARVPEPIPEFDEPEPIPEFDEPEPMPEKVELLQAAEATATSGDLSTLARQIVLFLLSERYGPSEAATALHTIPESVHAARSRIAPVVASYALGIAPTPECFSQVLALFTQQQEFRVTRKDIIAICAKVFKIDKGELLAKRRTKEVVFPRQVAMFICKKLTPCSFPDIGKSFGGRDHTTALHAVHKIENIARENGVDCGDDPRAWAIALARIYEATP